MKVKQNRTPIQFGLFRKVNEDVTPDKLAEGEIPLLIDGVLDFPFNSITRRGGFILKNNYQPTGAVSRIIDVKSSDGTDYLLAGNNSDRISRSVGGAWTDLKTGLSADYFSFAPFGDDFIFTNGVDTPFILSGATLATTATLEIIKPNIETVAGQYSTTNAGNLEPSHFYKWILIYITDDGEQSNPSNPFSYHPSEDGGSPTYTQPFPVSVYSTTGTKILFSNLPVSSDARVTKKKLYRTEGYQVGDTGSEARIFYLVATIDNDETQYADGKADADLDFDDVVYYQNVPSTAGHIVESNNRIFLANLVTIVKEYSTPVAFVRRYYSTTNQIASETRNSTMEAGATDWAGRGNHTVTIDSNSKLTGTYSIKIVSTAIGAYGTDEAYLGAGFINSVASGNRVNIRFNFRFDAPSTFGMAIKFGSLTAGIVDQYSDSWGVFEWEFTATAGEVGVPLQILNLDANTSYIDNIKITVNQQTVDSVTYHNYYNGHNYLTGALGWKHETPTASTGLREDKWYQHGITFINDRGEESDMVYGEVFRTGSGAGAGTKRRGIIYGVDTCGQGANYTEGAPFVVSRRLWRTTGQSSSFASQAKTMYLIAEESVESINRRSGSAWSFADIYDDTTATTYSQGTKENKSAIAWSEIDAPSYFLAGSIRQVFRDSRDEIVGIFDDGNGVLIFKENSIVKLYHTGHPENWYIRKVWNDHGCDEPKSIVKAGDVYFFRYRKKVYAYVSGQSPQYISFGKQKTLDNMTVIDAGANDEWYMLVCTYGTGHYLLVYDRKVETWYQFNFGTNDLTALLIKKFSDFWSAGNLYPVVGRRTFEYAPSQTYDDISGSPETIKMQIGLPRIKVDGAVFAKMRAMFVDLNRISAGTITTTIYGDSFGVAPITIGSGSSEGLLRVTTMPTLRSAYWDITIQGDIDAFRSARIDLRADTKL